MIIALSGKKGSGKDTIGKYFINKGFKRIAFADALKDICKIMFNLSDEQLNGDLKESIDIRYNKTPREILQYIGSLMRDNLDNLIQNMGKNIWINIVNNLIINNGYNYVITDLRYQNEYEFINNLKLKGFNIKFINVIRDNISTNYNNHESEKDILPCDYTIYNNDTIDMLILNVKLLLKDL